MNKLQDTYEGLKWIW